MQQRWKEQSIVCLLKDVGKNKVNCWIASFPCFCEGSWDFWICFVAWFFGRKKQRTGQDAIRLPSSSPAEEQNGPRKRHHDNWWLIFNGLYFNIKSNVLFLPSLMKGRNPFLAQS